MDRTKQINLNARIAVKIMEWHNDGGTWVNKESNFTGYYDESNLATNRDLVWDPCKNPYHALVVWGHEKLRNQAVHIQVQKPKQWRGNTAIQRNQTLFQMNHYDIYLDNHDHWVKVMDETAQEVICLCADVVIDILRCTKIHNDTLAEEKQKP